MLREEGKRRTEVLRPERPAVVKAAGPEVQSLFEALRTWRAAEAKAQRIPPYVIFHDTVLRDIAAVRPSEHRGARSDQGRGNIEAAALRSVRAGSSREYGLTRLRPSARPSELTVYRRSPRSHQGGSAHVQQYGAAGLAGIGTQRTRAWRSASPCGDCHDCRHDDRVVRLLPLQHRHRAGVRQALLPALRSAGRHAGGVRHLRGRLCRAADRCGDLRPLGRPPRAQVGADRHADADGHRDVPGRPGADLREHRHLGRGPADGAALHPGRGRRRRMGRLGAAVDGMGAHQPPSRLRRILAAVRRAGRAVPRQPRRAGVQLAVGRCVPHLGLARAVPDQHRARRHRPLDPSGHSGDADLPPPGGGEPHRARADRRGVPPAMRRRSSSALSRAWPNRRRSTSSPLSSSPMASAR